MNYQQLQFVAHFLDPIKDQPSVKVQQQKVQRFFGAEPMLLASFFDDQEIVYLSRKEIFSRSRRGPTDLFALSVLLWGFPTNQHGVCGHALQNWENLMEWVGHLRRNREMTLQQLEEMIPHMHNMRGLGISTFSKYMYFMGCRINGHCCLILDDRVAKGIWNLTGSEFDDLKAATQNNNHRVYRNYPAFLEAMENISTTMGVASHNLEYVLWLASRL
jgi:hypothetical protein